MGVLGSAVAAWVCVYAAVKVADARSAGRVSGMLHARNVTMHAGMVQVTTTALNSRIQNVGKRHRRLLSQWFLVGVVMSAFALLTSLFILSSHIFAALLPASMVGVPRIPGTFAHFSGAAGHVDLPPQMAKLGRWTAKGKDKLMKIGQWRSARRVKKRATFRGYHDRAKLQQRRQLEQLRQQERVGHADAAAVGNVGGGEQKAEGASLSAHFDSQTGARDVEAELRTASRFLLPRPPAQPQMRRPPDVALRTRQVVDGGAQLDAQAAPAPVEHVKEGGVVDVADAASGAPGAPKPPSRRAMLTLLVPGVTIPAGDVLYLGIALLCAMAVHELGHALAAATHDAQVAGVGAFVAFVFPGAYVQLEGVERLSVPAQLQVYCGGVWHNVVTALLALALAGALPTLGTLFYVPLAGALVVDVPTHSPLRNHVERGDVLSRFGRYPVVDGGRSFRAAVAQLARSNDTAGFCVSGALFAQHWARDARCCESRFADVDAETQCFAVAGIPRRRACLRTDVVSAQRLCRSSAQCRQGEGARVGRTLRAVDGGSTAGETLDRETCFVAVLPGGARLVDVHIRSLRTRTEQRLIYEGYPEVLAHAVSVSSYVPRLWDVLPVRLLRVVAATDVPNHLHRLLTYFASLSFAIALLNVIPVPRLDGEHIVPLFLRLVHPKLSSSSERRVRTFGCRFGSALLALNVLLSLVQYVAA